MSSAAITGRTPGYCPLQRGVRRHSAWRCESRSRGVERCDGRPEGGTRSSAPSNSRIVQWRLLSCTVRRADWGRHSRRNRSNRSVGRVDGLVRDWWCWPWRPATARLQRGSTPPQCWLRRGTRGRRVGAEYRPPTRACRGQSAGRGPSIAWHRRRRKRERSFPDLRFPRLCRVTPNGT